MNIKLMKYIELTWCFKILILRQKLVSNGMNLNIKWSCKQNSDIYGQWYLFI